MRHLLLLALIVARAAAGIIKVDIAAAPRLAGVSCHGCAGDWLLVDDSPESRARLAAEQVVFEPLSGPAMPTHAVVTPLGPELRCLAAGEVRQLRRSGADVVRLPERPYPLRIPDERGIPRRVPSDTFIRRIINRVSADSIRARMARLEAFRTRYTPTESCRAAEQYVHDYLSSLGVDSVCFDGYMTGYRNIIGIKLGRTRPEAVIVIGGHLDAISEDPWQLAPGMEDNASGTCVALEAARVLAGENLDCTVQFCAFTGEEEGLYGSDHYARLLRAQNANVIAMLNYDMVSWPGDSWGMALAGLARRLGEYEAAVMDEYTTLHHRLQVRSFPSDSRSFDNVGYPAMSGYEYGSRPYVWYHTTGDTLGNCHLGLAAEVAQAAVATLASLALAPLAPDSLRLADCGNGTSLLATWAAGSEPDLAGYKLLWGRTAGGYSDSVVLGRVFSCRIDGLAADSLYHFAVVAFDSAGHESGTSAEDSAVPRLVPRAPTGVACRPFLRGNRVGWQRSREIDIQGYNVYRSTRPDSGFVRLNSSLVSDTVLSDSGLMSDTMYHYRVTAVDSTAHESPASVTVRGKPVTLDHGILLVDETRDGSGQPGSPSDEQQDAFWHALLAGYAYSDWDAARDGVPLGADFGPYSTIVWHADDYTQQLADTAVPGLANHLAHGGRVWYSGWKPVVGLLGAGSYPFIFAPGQFLYEFGHLLAARQSPTAVFSGAAGSSGYPAVTVDSAKLVSALHGRLPFVDCLVPRDADTVLTFVSSDTFHGQPVGTRWLLGPGRVVLFGFPFYYMKEHEARLVARKVLEDLGEPYGITETGSVAPRLALELRPSPARGAVRISCVLSGSGPARLALYDASGREVRKSVPGGRQSDIVMDVRSLPSGMYFCRLTSGTAQVTRKLVLD